MTTTIDNRAKTLRELTALSWELPVPPIWSDRYLLLFGICHRWANAAHQVARATANSDLCRELAARRELMESMGLDPRDYGFEAPTAFDLDLPAQTVWGRA